jgi:hypothetical protein
LILARPRLGLIARNAIGPLGPLLLLTLLLLLLSVCRRRILPCLRTG